MKKLSPTFRYPVKPLQALVLLQNVLNCPDAENDADRTVEELCLEIDMFDGYLSKGVLESALYCCNMNDESPDGQKTKFWHPRGMSFQRFISDLLPANQRFDRYYNVLHEEKKDGYDDKNRR